MKLGRPTNGGSLAADPNFADASSYPRQSGRGQVSFGLTAYCESADSGGHRGSVGAIATSWALMTAAERSRPADWRPLHHDEAGPLQMLDKALGDESQT